MDPSLVPAWTSLFLGLFAFCAGIGELRARGHWQKMVEELAASPALQIIVAMVELFLGAVVYLANPWAGAEWLSRAMHVIGGLMALEALVVLAAPDLYLSFWLRRFGPLGRAWAWLSMLFGVVLIAVAVLRF
ncbi:MAG: hypothetical protein JF593_11975 [Novosphingobium sp.]|nr:hypothetical protein [Novosphingobium sp.]